MLEQEGGSLGSGNPRHQRSGAVGETRYGPSCRNKSLTRDLGSGKLQVEGSEVEGENLESGTLSKSKETRWKQHLCLRVGNEMRVQRRQGSCRVCTGRIRSDCGKTGGDTQESFFCMHPEDAERIR